MLTGHTPWTDLTGIMTTTTSYSGDRPRITVPYARGLKMSAKMYRRLWLFAIMGAMGGMLLSFDHVGLKDLLSTMFISAITYGFATDTL